MAHDLRCYRCGASLAALTLPLARLDECPQCRVHLHACRMCERYAPRKPKGCSEDDAIEVRDKKAANFERMHGATRGSGRLDHAAIAQSK